MNCAARFLAQHQADAQVGDYLTVSVAQRHSNASDIRPKLLLEPCEIAQQTIIFRVFPDNIRCWALAGG
jgi:hypothetical protein